MSAAEIREGDCVAVLSELGAETLDAIVTDPPYSLGFMSKAWDVQVEHGAWSREAFRALKPGGHLLAFGGTRTFHRLTVALEDAGFEIRDCLMWLYGSGFPKSLDVSKAIDKAAGAEKIIGTKPDRWTGKGSSLNFSTDRPQSECKVTAPATDAAREWAGWGTALKPAWEPIILARKPLSGTVAANVQRWGTGALNVDGCRVAGEPREPVTGFYNRSYMERRATQPWKGKGGPDESAAVQPNSLGRWPANVVLGHADGCEEPAPCVAGCPVALLDDQSGETGGGFGVRGGGPTEGRTSYAMPGQGQVVGFGDTGGASRFFYTAKAGRAERNAGLEDFAKRPLLWSSGEQNPGSFQAPGTERAARNFHPTVKPVDLMQWLCRLVTPAGGLVCDPFMGSGSTGIAALREGFRFLGIEREAEYCAIARRRIEEDSPLFQRGIFDEGQLELFDPTMGRE